MRQPHVGTEPLLWYPHVSPTLQHQSKPILHSLVCETHCVPLATPAPSHVVPSNGPKWLAHVSPLLQHQSTPATQPKVCETHWPPPLVAWLAGGFPQVTEHGLISSCRGSQWPLLHCIPSP